MPDNSSMAAAHSSLRSHVICFPPIYVASPQIYGCSIAEMEKRRKAVPQTCDLRGLLQSRDFGQDFIGTHPRRMIEYLRGHHKLVRLVIGDERLQPAANGGRR